MSLQYAVRHVSRFAYSEPVRETLMELRMQPRSEDNQICLGFEVSVSPQARIQFFRDYLGNTVHHFDIPQPVQELTITAAARVQMQPPRSLPNQLEASAWAEIDEGDYFDFLTATASTRAGSGLAELRSELNLARRGDPLSLLRELNQGVHQRFRCSKKSETSLESLLEKKEGSCHDLAHLFIALAREVGIPCRFVSGYLSKPEGAHAWVEAFLPALGWVGFDPSGNVLAGERHIVGAIGRDFSEVPPTRGTFKGEASSEVSMAVQVRLAGQPMGEDRFRPLSGEFPELPSTPGWYAQQQQAQQ